LPDIQDSSGERLNASATCAQWTHGFTGWQDTRKREETGLTSQIGEGTIDIIGVPHKHMDVAGHLAVNDLQNNFPLLPEGALSIMPAATPSHWPTHHAPAG
jgi:hypothetical protein